MSLRVKTNYTNYRGEESVRDILLYPSTLRYGANEWHPEPQWLIDGYDLAKEVTRTFALKDMKPVSQETTVP